MSSRTWLAVVVFVFMAVLTIVSLVCCGMAMSRSFAYEADIRNNEQRLTDLQQAIVQTQSQSKAEKIALETESDKLRTERNTALDEKSKAEANKRNAESSYAEQKRTLDAVKSELANTRDLLADMREEKSKLEGDVAKLKKEADVSNLT